MAVPPPPERQEHKEPGRHQHRDEQNEARADDDDQRNHDCRRDRNDREHLELVAPHPPQQRLVLLGRDLLSVPRAPARLAAPAVAVGDLSLLAALAPDRDRRPAQVEPNCTAQFVYSAPGAVESRLGRCYLRPRGPGIAVGGPGIAEEEEGTWLRRSSRNASSSRRFAGTTDS